MTRKEAARIVARASKTFPKLIGKWKVGAVTIRPKSTWGRTFAVGFFSECDSPTLSNKGFMRRLEGGWSFTRKWLEEHGHI